MEMHCCWLSVIVVVEDVLFGNRYRSYVNNMTQYEFAWASNDNGTLAPRGAHRRFQNSERHQYRRFAGVVWADKDVEVPKIDGEPIESFEMIEFHSDELMRFE